MSSDTHDDPFNITATRTLTQTERYRRLFDLWVASPGRIVWQDLRTRVGVLIMLFFVFVGTAGPYLVSKPSQNEGPAFVQPFETWTHPLGTDGMGADMMGLLVHSTPAMLKMIIAGALFTTVMATLVGTVSGYMGGRVDKVLTMITDVTIAIPGLPLVIVLAIAIEPRDPYLVGFILTVNAWAGLGRTIRAQVLSIRQQSYVEASQFMGLSVPIIIAKDILPNMMPYILISFMQSARNVVFASVGLYYLGLLPFTVLNWGVMMNMARQRGSLTSWEAAHWLLGPMIAITLLTTGMILFAQGMDRVFNPRVRARHASTASETPEHEH